VVPVADHAEAHDHREGVVPVQAEARDHREVWCGAQAEACYCQVVVGVSRSLRPPGVVVWRERKPGPAAAGRCSGAGGRPR